MAPAQRWTKVVRPLLGAVGFCSWFGNSAFFLILERHAPDVPAAGLTSALSNHGHDFFVRPWQSYLFSIALIGSMLLFATNLSETNSAIHEGRWRVILPAALTSCIAWAALVFYTLAGTR